MKSMRNFVLATIFFALVGACVGQYAIWNIPPAQAQSPTPGVGNFRSGNAVKLIVALTNTATSVKGGPGLTQALLCNNPNGSVVFVQIFDVVGTVTVGTTPPKLSIPLPASTTTLVGGLNVNMFNAIQVAATTAITGGTAPATALPCNVIFQ